MVLSWYSINALKWLVFTFILFMQKPTLHCWHYLSDVNIFSTDPIIWLFCLNGYSRFLLTFLRKSQWRDERELNQFFDVRQLWFLLKRIVCNKKLIELDYNTCTSSSMGETIIFIHEEEHVHTCIITIKTQ